MGSVDSAVQRLNWYSPKRSSRIQPPPYWLRSCKKYSHDPVNMTWPVGWGDATDSSMPDCAVNACAKPASVDGSSCRSCCPRVMVSECLPDKFHTKSPPGSACLSAGSARPDHATTPSTVSRTALRLPRLMLSTS